MIFYFSGTGNSLYAAKKIAEDNHELLVSISDKMNKADGPIEFTLKEDENIGFVYPVYAWGPPKMVIDFIERLKLQNYKHNYTFCVITCGDNIGNAMEKMIMQLRQKGITLNSGFSLQMPNNYIISFDVDSEAIEKKKLIQADDALKHISNLIRRKSRDVVEVVKGPLPWLYTGLINPLFQKFAVNTNRFWADQKCNGCGICEKVCNCMNIKVNGKPQWGARCCQCLACIHYCPQKAIQYGKSTERKGRYTNPNIKVKEMMIADKK